MKRLTFILVIILAFAAHESHLKACTSAIISADATLDGRPLLWKNRDTSATDNKVEAVFPADGRLGYVALYNASDKECKEAWIGMNESGFAIMNTASYNLNTPKEQLPASQMDKEGEVMTLALGSCRTVDDFERLLQELPKPLGVEANFGVIDALGNGAYFETGNYRFVRFDVKDAPEGYLVRTNYSHSGRAGEGYGFTREKDAISLLDKAAKAGAVTPELLTETLSRSFYNATLQKDFSRESGYVVDEGFIPRYKTTSTVVIEGCYPQQSVDDISKTALADQYIMWTALGYPPCARIVPVWCAPDGVHESLRGIGPDGRSPACDEAKALRDEVFRSKGGEKSVYIDMKRLFNDNGTGICQKLREENLEIYRVIKAKRPKRIAL